MGEEFKTPVELKPSPGLEKEPVKKPGYQSSMLEMDEELKKPVELKPSFSRQSSKPGTSPSKLLPGHSSPAPPDPHLSKWSVLESWLVPRLPPFPLSFWSSPTSCIVATPSNDIAVRARDKSVIIYDIKGFPKEIIRIQEEIFNFAFVSYTATQDRLVVIQENNPYVKMYTMKGTVDFQFLTKHYDGKREEAAGLVIACPWSIAVKKDGTIVVGDLALYVLTEHRPNDGRILRTMQVKIKPEYLAVDDDDRIFVSDCHTVLVVDESSADSITFQPTLDGRTAEVFGLCCSKKDIFVGLSVDKRRTGRIHRFDHRGMFVECIGEHLNHPNGFTFTGQRHLAVAAYNGVMIFKEELKTQERDRLGHRETKLPIRRAYTEPSAQYEDPYYIHDLDAYALPMNSPTLTTGWTSQTKPKTSKTDEDEEFYSSLFDMESTDVFEEQSLGEKYFFEGMDEELKMQGKKHSEGFKPQGEKAKMHRHIVQEGAASWTTGRIPSLYPGHGNYSMMASQTKPKFKTGRDTKHHTSRKPSHLQLVLDEVNKRTKYLSANERLHTRLQLPYIAMGYFNEKGGSLSLDEYDVHLTIPRGAIAPGSQQQVYIYVEHVDPTAPTDDAIEQTEVALSPNVKCGPEGLKFTESVVLSFPHHAVLKKQSYDKLVVRMRHDDSKDRQWEDGNPALVTEKKAFVLVDHFTIFSLVGTPNQRSSKRMKVAAFGGHLDRRSCQYTFRVHVWNDEKNVEKYVLRKEQHMNSRIYGDVRNLEFFCKSGDLAVRVSDVEGGWAIRGAAKQVINKESVRVFTDNSVIFDLQRLPGDSEDRGLYCLTHTYQCSLDGDLMDQTEVLLTICAHHSGVKSTRGRCTCYQRDGAAALCDNCKEQIGNGISTMVHGEVDPQAFGRLSEKAVWSLCDHLDRGRDGLSNWNRLVEQITNMPGRSVQVAVESGRLCTRGLLQLYFDVCRDTNKTDNEAIETFVGVLSGMGWTEL